MKKLLYFLLIAFFLVSCAKKNWKDTLEENSIEAFQTFIDENPESEFLEIAEFKLDSLTHQKDSIDWAYAEEKDTKEAYQNYINENPEGEFVNDAENSIKWLTDDEIWLGVNKTPKDINDFLENYPDNRNDYKARDLMDDILKEDFENNYIEVIDFFYSVSEDQSFSAIDQFIDENILFIHNAEAWGEGETKTFVVDSMSYQETIIPYLLTDLKQIYIDGGVYLTYFDEYGEYDDEDEYLYEYKLEYFPNGITFLVYGDCENYYFTFIYKNSKLYLKKIYYEEEYCDI
ncbi:MAG: hypothetical protein JXL97_03895 [Bacteroidales bacterium]|nr:hypothetical protein [Bacteroidales bacterium]